MEVTVSRVGGGDCKGGEFARGEGGTSHDLLILHCLQFHSLPLVLAPKLLQPRCIPIPSTPSESHEHKLSDLSHGSMDAFDHASVAMSEPCLTSHENSPWLAVRHTVSCRRPPPLACKGLKHSASKINSSALTAPLTLTPGPSFANITESVYPSSKCTRQIHRSTLDSGPLGISHCCCCHCYTLPPQVACVNDIP